MASAETSPPKTEQQHQDELREAEKERKRLRRAARKSS